MYQSTLWCACEGSDNFGFFPKKVKQSFHLSDPNIDLYSGNDILVNEAHELALAKDSNESKEPELGIDSDNEDMDLYAVLEAVEAANGSMDSTSEEKNKLDGNGKVWRKDTLVNEAYKFALAGDSNESKEPEGGIDSDNEDMNLSAVLEAVERANRSSTNDEKNKLDENDKERGLIVTTKALERDEGDI